MSDVLVDSSTNNVGQKQNNKSPMVRFDGFTDDWEQRKLGDVVRNIGTGKSKFKISEESSYTNYAVLGSTSIIGFDTDYDYEGNFILTARVGANAGTLYQYSGKVKITDNTVYIQGDNLSFLYSLLNNFNLKKLSFGTGQPLIKSSELKKIALKFPDKEEQIKIGSFFKRFDNTIALHQRKLGQLIFQKKYLLQNIFPKKRVTNRALKISDDICSDERMCDMFSLVSSKGRTDIPFVTVKEYETIERSSAIQGYGNDMSENAKQKAKIILKNQFLIDLSSFEHGIYKASMDGLTSNAYFVLNLDHGCHDYWSRFFTSHNFIQSLKKLTPPGARQGKMIEVKAFLNESYMVPSLEEQQKIGALFNAMDHRIQVQETKIKQLQEMKKAILQRMFV